MGKKYYISSDKINKKEHSYMNSLAKALKERGHTVKVGVVDPNGTQHFGTKTSSKGWVGVHIQGGCALETFSDLCYGVKRGYYHYDYIYCLGSSEFTNNKHISSKVMNEKHTYTEPDVASMKKYTYGKTPNEINEYWKKQGQVCYNDKWQGCIDFICGEGGSNESSKNNTASTTIMNYKDMLKDLTKIWDGEVEIKIENDTVNINKINTKPTTLAKEGVNIITGSLNLSDYNNNTVNTLICKYDNDKKQIVIRDEYLLNRFGEVTSTVKAIDIVEEKIDKKKTKQVKKSITKYDEALDFAKKEWNKLKRDDGHTIELKVVGDYRFRVGEYCEVYIPRFNESINMCISKVSHSLSSNSEWETNLNLVDYTPSLKKDEGETTNG